MRSQPRDGRFDVSPQISRRMAAVRRNGTAPELAVRSIVHRLGYRFRLHSPKLPGKPDLVLPRLRRVILVHGCFWHRHGCSRATEPRTHVEYWSRKFERNIERDSRNVHALGELGWTVLIVWECETRDVPSLEVRLQGFLREECS